VIGAGPVWLIGCGNMGRAMLDGWLSHGMGAHDVLVVDPALPNCPEGVQLVDAIPAGAPCPALVLLAVKPQMLREIAPILNAALGTTTMVMSILAGVECAKLRQALPAPEQIVRVMPNMPASIGKGVSVVYAADADDARRVQIASLLKPLGMVEWIEDEYLFHAVTALSGSGPAFVFRFINALAQSGAALGLPAEQALRLAIGTVEGAAALAAQSGDGPAKLAARVTSPQGTTAAGLAVLDEAGLFEQRVAATLDAAAARSRELAANG
jgi:pyrroline-5-carboxylate reductase